MASEKQKQANKKNAKLSSGPKTPAGKSKVAKNAIQHGIFTKELVINAGDGKEDLDDYKALLDGLMADLLPQGIMESLLVEKIAVNYWRLRRLVRYETGELRDRLDDFENELIENHLNPTLAYYQMETPPKPLKCLSYDDEISDKEFHEQSSLVAELMIQDIDLTSIEFVLEYVLIHNFEHEYLVVSKEDLNKARQFIQKLSPEKKVELRAKILEQEWDHLSEMKEVRKMQIKFDQISRMRSPANSNDLDKIIKYETSLKRSILQNLAALYTLQKKRIKVIDANKNE